MAKVLVTGATGVLGRRLLPALAAAGHTVRALSRRPRTGGDPGAAEWCVGDLITGQGLAAAVDGAEVIVHAATSPFRATRAVDADGTARLLELARRAGTAHFVYISIIGVDQVPLGYYRQKQAAEGAVRAGGVPWTILRAAQFHTLIDGLLRPLRRMPVGLLPLDFRFQPIDPAELARRVADHVGQGPAGRLPDLGGPEVLTLGQMAREWLAVQGLRRPLIRLPLPGRVAAAFRRGATTAPAHPAAGLTWSQWLRAAYGAVR